MKIWTSYGSEHSMNLVMVGTFKTAEDATQAKELSERLTEVLQHKVELDGQTTRFPDDVRDVLRNENFHSLSPQEVEHFSYEHWIEQEKETLIFKTEESEFSAFLKLFLDKGAKVEVYSAHDFPDEEFGRGK
ncbi:DUF6375 family protein [Cognaticolwellia beringensis]|uniref:Uncharacterized protein n=1 Tax=Cognaticolwellia beringensis TaxID=1967665 RepID=A0A222G723_9GAMM|nr:DUF6375 family protein [Cognaticolwellia beringensis]ASP47403.1 hypothetical protein B5D82_06305 [Cognaticolwellia beringensis]